MQPSNCCTEASPSAYGSPVCLCTHYLISCGVALLAGGRCCSEATVLGEGVLCVFTEGIWGHWSVGSCVFTRGVWQEAILLVLHGLVVLTSLEVT